jgi:4-hydroxybenzoate polyprenyltransferase
LSSGVYLINDILDRDVDRRHPQKSARPIASGSLSVLTAAVAATVLLVGALAAAIVVGSTFALVALVYVAVMTTYSLVLKHHLILDALAVASGFVLRALAGAVAVGVSFSHWLLILTLLLALFLALGKRRAELIVLGAHAPDHRRTLAYYSPALLDQLLGIVTASTLLAYAFYTISAETIAKFGNDWLLLTFPFPLYGLFRYLHLVQQGGGGDPAEHLFSDGPLLLCVGLWGIAVILIVYGPWR